MEREKVSVCDCGGLMKRTCGDERCLWSLAVSEAVLMVRLLGNFTLWLPSGDAEMDLACSINQSREPLLLQRE